MRLVISSPKHPRQSKAEVSAEMPVVFDIIINIMQLPAI